MCRAIAKYPTTKIIRIVATAMIAIGTPSRPVTAKAVLTTSATTVSGATDEAIVEPIANAPSRLRANAVETVLPARGADTADTMKSS
ncbi:hypothetical protein Ari01nite_69420 [Paractinoplanes rishiriensis]|uniref:Uncharacterized protein n=1 Tax=Paractinoplanes rishiriensis TaxID=1050105 RepID=A0A919K636_9ACTN|nr:hypothetical protein Ari01nite_69420 [Actinoplanes rishiriensis]